MESPNPVTVVTPAQIAVMAPTNLIEGLGELPQFYGSATTQTPSPFFTSTGAGSLNLRGLQSNRICNCWMAGASSSRRSSAAQTSICFRRTSSREWKP